MNFGFWKLFRSKKIQDKEKSFNKPYVLLSWQDYWDLYSKLIGLLNAEGKTSIVIGLQEAQRKNVNGLTDGWYEFKFAFVKTLEANRHNMTEEQTDIADFLMQKLNASLANR